MERGRAQPSLVLGFAFLLLAMGVGLAMVIAVTFGIPMGTMPAFFLAMSLEKLAGLGPLVLFTGGREKGGESESGGNERGLHAWRVNLSDCHAHTSGQTRPRKAETVKRGCDKMTEGENTCLPAHGPGILARWHSQKCSFNWCGLG